jgi:ankyrin repeat protein
MDLILTSREGRLEIVNSLIEAGAFLDVRDNGGDTALIWVSRNALWKLSID